VSAWWWVIIVFAFSIGVLIPVLWVVKLLADSKDISDSEQE
jgi:hypothetical protein